MLEQGESKEDSGIAAAAPTNCSAQGLIQPGKLRPVARKWHLAWQWQMPGFLRLTTARSWRGLGFFGAMGKKHPTLALSPSLGEMSQGGDILSARILEDNSSFLLVAGRPQLWTGQTYPHRLLMPRGCQTGWVGGCTLSHLDPS